MDKSLCMYKVKVACNESSVCNVLNFGLQFSHYLVRIMAFYRWSRIGLIITVLMVDVTIQEIHRAKPNPHKSAAKQGKVDVAAAADSKKSFEVMSEFNLEIWAYSVIAAALVGLSGIFPLLVIPMEAGPALKHGGKYIAKNICLDPTFFLLL